MNNNQKVLICYNEPFSFYQNYSGKTTEDNSMIDLSETDFISHLNTIKSIIKKKYKEVKVLPVNSDITQTINGIKNFSPDIIMNFVESVNGKSHFESYISGMYDLMGYNFTGNTAACLLNCLDKSLTKTILKSHKINTPEFLVAHYNKKLNSNNFKLKFPVILKLLYEDASIGISELSVVNNFSDLSKRLNFLFKNFKQDVLIEEYISGREFNIAILDRKVLPISEIIFDGLPKDLPKIVTYEGKWSEDSIYFKFTNPDCPAKIGRELKKTLKDIAIKAFDIMGCRDYARVDIRINQNSKPYVLEVNPNPDISLDSGFARSAKAAGIRYEQLLLRILEIGLNRKNEIA